MRRCVGILFINQHRRFLLQHRDQGIDRMPGYWGFFGGGIERGETPDEAIIRETKEELGIIPLHHSLTLSQSFVDEFDGKGKKYIYTASFDVQQSIQLLEGQGMGWFSIDEIGVLQMISHDRSALKQIFSSE